MCVYTCFSLLNISIFLIWFFLFSGIIILWKGYSIYHLLTPTLAFLNIQRWCDGLYGEYPKLNEYSELTKWKTLYLYHFLAFLLMKWWNFVGIFFWSHEDNVMGNLIWLFIFKAKQMLRVIACQRKQKRNQWRNL